MKQALFAVIWLFAGNMVAQNRSIVFEQAGVDASLGKAKVENKLVFIDCYTSWCGPCKEMSKRVFTKDTVADFFNARFVNMKIDMEKGEGPALAKEFYVEAFPTYLLLNSERKVVYRFVGAMSADTFLAKISKGMDPKNLVAVLNERYAAGDRSKELLREYIQVKIEGMEISVGKKMANEYFDMLSPSEKTLPGNWFLFGENRYSMYLSNIRSRTFSYLADHWHDFVKQNGKEAVENKLTTMYRKITEYSLRGWYFKGDDKKPIPYDKKEFEQYKKQIKNTKLTDKDQLLTLMDISMAAGEKDTALITGLMAKHIGNMSGENQKVAFAYFSMFPASKVRNNPHIGQIIDAIIKTNRSGNLVHFAKSLK